MFKTNLKTALILLTVFFLIAGCSKIGKTKEELLKEGVKLMDENNYKGAIVLFKNAIEKDQNFFEARLQLAKAYIHIANFDSAEKELQKVIRQNPSLQDAHIELARVYLFKSKPEDAIKEIGGFITDTSNNADVFEIAGGAYAVKGDYPASINFLKKAISNNGKPTAGIALTKVYMIMNRNDDAKSQISDVIKKYPSNKAALYTLAALQVKGNDVDGAINTYEKILKEHSSEIEAQFKKGVLHMEKGQFDEALSISDKLINSFPKIADGYRLKGMALFYKKKLDDAIIELQRSISIAPNIASYYYLGLCYYNKNELELAISELQRALDINPSLVQARALISLTLLKQNRIDDSITAIKLVIETNEDDAFAHNILGSAYMAKGMYEEGMEELNRAIELDPGLIDVHIKKGLFNISKGKFKEAEIELKTAVEAAPEVLNSRVMLASYYTRHKDYDKAINILNEGIKGQKSDAILYNLLADAFLQQNKAADAIKYLQKAKEVNPDHLSSYFNLSSVYFIAGEQEKGIQELKTIIEKSSDNLKALLSLAAILETKGKEEEALKYYNQAKGTGKSEGYLAFANYHLRKKDLNNALKVLEEAIAKNPSGIQLYEFKGRLLFSLKKFEDALKTFEYIEKANPRLGITYTINTYMAMNKSGEALNRIRKEIKKNPEDLNLMAEVSRIYKVIGKKDMALENAKEIINKKPESPVGYMTLALIYQDDKEPDKAIDALKKVSGSKDINVYMMLGNLYRLKKDYTSSMNIYNKAEGLKSGYVPVIFQKGTLFQEMGKKKEAIDEYQRVLRLSVNHIPTLNNLAYLYAEDNSNLTNALQIAIRASTLAPENGAIIDTLGFVQFKNKKIEDALKSFKKAAELIPDNPSIYYHIALAYKEYGDKVKAMENLQKALQLGDFPESKDAKLLLDKLKKG